MASLVISCHLAFVNRSGGLSEMSHLCRRFDYKITNAQPSAFLRFVFSRVIKGLVVDVRRPLSHGLSFSDGYCVCLDGFIASAHFQVDALKNI